MKISSLKNISFATLGTGIVLGVMFTSVVTAAFPGSSIFSDVPAGHFADNAIGHMFELGVIKGRDASHFDPNGNLTRAEAALLLERLYSVIEGTNVASSSSSSSSSLSSHRSTSSVSSSTFSTNTSQAVTTYYSFSATEYAVMENGNSATITILRTGDTGQIGNISYSTTSDTATINDYGGAAGALTFTSGETTKTFTVTTKNNTFSDGTRKVNLTLSSPSPGGALFAPVTAKLLIYDDEAVELNDSSAFRFSPDAVTASQSNGKAYVTVTRSGSIGTATVSYATLNGSGTAGVDYTATTGSVSFAIGETSKTISIPVLTSTEGAGKTFQVQLSSPVSGTIPDSGLVTVTIQ